MFPFILNIILHLVSFAFALLVVARIFTHVQKYRFEKANYDRLLGGIHLRWVVWMYLFVIIASGVFSSLLILTFVAS